MLAEIDPLSDGRFPERTGPAAKTGSALEQFDPKSSASQGRCPCQPRQPAANNRYGKRILLPSQLPKALMQVFGTHPQKTTASL